MWIIYILLIALILIFSDATIEAARSSVELFAYGVIPSLFPFFVLTNMLLNKGNKAFLSGFLCGYPSGAIVCSSLYEDGKIIKSKAEIYSAFINNAGPAFVIGTVGAIFCRSLNAGILLLFTHIAASLTVMITLKMIVPETSIETVATYSIPNSGKNHNFSKTPLGEQLSAAILSSAKQIASVGGYIIFFSVLISILSSIGVKNIYLFAFLEITSGLKYITQSLPQDNFIQSLTNMLPIIAFFLGFSGLSIHIQIIAILNKSKLNARYFIAGKIMQAILAAIYTFLLLKLPFIKNLL